MNMVTEKLRLANGTKVVVVLNSGECRGEIMNYTTSESRGRAKKVYQVKLFNHPTLKTCCVDPQRVIAV